MTTPTNIKVIGFDKERPPMIQPIPCIDLNFELDQPAPPEWCDILPTMVGKSRLPLKIAADPGLFVETWVRTPREIEAALVSVKTFVADCNVAYDEAQARKRMVVPTEEKDTTITPEQAALNRVVEALDFES